jgi:putative ABC transport system permease protein
VSDGYFGTVGTRILRGRAFGATDVAGAEPVAIVGQTFATMVWPDRDALGQCLYVGRNDSTCVRVVGVAADARSRSVTEERTLLYYLPFAEHLVPMPVDNVLIRTRGPAREASAEVQRALQGTEPGLPYVRVDPLLDFIQPQWRSWRLGATMLSAFGLLALVIAALGLYGVTAYGVSQRTQEIGVRVALGAQRGDVIWLSVTQAVRATAIGAAIGLAIAFALGRAVSALLFGVKPLDPTSLLGGVAVLLAVAAVASYVPARRAALIDPMEALRYE